MNICIRILAVAMLFAAPSLFATTHTVSNSGLAFSPSSITISVGDTVVFSISSSHDAVEVSQSTWSAGGNTPLSGGWSVGFGGGTVVFTAPATHYYVCTPHASLGMKGTITVEQTSITTGTLAQSSFCSGDGVTVPFTATGTFQNGNVYTAQLSDAAGGFASPVAIGTLSSTTSGQINATIPANTPSGSGYRVRVISSLPAVTGSDNGSDLAIAQIPTASISPAGPTTFCEGGSVVLNATMGPGLTYVWRRNSTVIPGAGASSYTASESGLYAVEISSGGCSSTSSPRPVTVLPGNPTTLTWTAGVDTDWGTVGNWNSQCAVPTAGDTVIIPGSLQPPTGIPTLSLARLVVNNAAGITLTSDLEITGSLVLTNGNVTLGSASLSLSGSASISGAGASSFIVTDGSGELRQASLGSGGRTGAVLFPVGSNGLSYTPVLVQNSATADEFRVRVSDDVLTDGGSGFPLSTNVVDKTWFISEASPGGSSADLTFQWNGSDELPAFTRASCWIAHHDGMQWLPLQSLGAATGGMPYQRSVSGVSSFSPFAIGDASSPLPVEYRTLAADVIDGSVMLRWETESETGNAGFDIQRRSGTAHVWNTLHYLTSRAADGGSARYTFVDLPPAGGEWVYRLRQIDHDGSEEYSPELRVNFNAAARALAITSMYPQPVSQSAAPVTEVSFSTPDDGAATLDVFNLLGQQVMTVFSGSVRAAGQTVVRFNTADLPPGVYIMRLGHGNNFTHRRFVISR